MKKIIISNTKKRCVQNKFQPELLVNQLLLGCEFGEGTEAHMKYAHGKLTVIVGKVPKVLE